MDKVWDRSATFMLLVWLIGLNMGQGDAPRRPSRCAAVISKLTIGDAWARAFGDVLECTFGDVLECTFGDVLECMFGDVLSV